MTGIQRRSLATRARLLAVAIGLAESHGIENVSMEMLAREAGVAKGTIFAHFHDRAGLVSAIGHQGMAEVLDALESDLSGVTPATLVDGVTHACGRLTRYLVQNPAFARLFVDQSTFSDGFWSAHFIADCHRLERAVAGAISATLGAREERAALLAGGTMAFLTQCVMYRLAGWLKDDDQASTRLQAYLEIWLANKS